MPYQMICLKTGRFWPCKNYRHGDALAMTHGVKDYDIKDAAQ